MSKIYLAGPISGLTFEQSKGWRIRCGCCIYQKHELFDPLLVSDKDFVGNDGTFGNGKELDDLVSDMFFARDMYWTREADIVIANFTIIPDKLGAGTIFELGAAFALNKVVVLVGPKENIPLFALKGASVHFETIDKAINYVNTF